jgi:hypothetical protein
VTKVTLIQGQLRAPNAKMVSFLTGRSTVAYFCTWWQDLPLDFHSMKSQRLCADKKKQVLRLIMDSELSACVIARNIETKKILVVPCGV